MVKNLKYFLGTLGLATTISLTGCGNTNTSQVDFHYVAEIDGNIEIIKKTEPSSFDDNEKKHNHYQNIFNKKKYTTYEECGLSSYTNYLDINLIGPFKEFLTEDEIMQAAAGMLTEEDYKNIYNRICEEIKNKDNVLSK